jgi:hypothetical protein
MLGFAHSSILPCQWLCLWSCTVNVGALALTALCIIDDSSLRDTKKMKVDPNVGLGLIACTCTLFFRGNTIQKTGYSSDLYNSLQQPQ